MRKLLLVGILFMTGFISKAQKVYFTYLESENGIPFYVKMGDKVYSSSTAGYLILSNLKDSTYTIAIGLVKKRDVEPKFQIVVGGTDHGYLIKDLGEKLNLFDLQSLELMAPIAAAEVENNETYITRTDNFTRTLSQAADDPSLLLEAVRKEPVKTVAKNKSVPKEVAVDQAIAKEATTNNPITPDTTTPGSLGTLVAAAAASEVKTSDSTTAILDTAAKSMIATATIDSAGVAKVDSSVKSDSVAILAVAGTENVVKAEEKKGSDIKGDELKRDGSKLEGDSAALKTDSTSISTTSINDTTIASGIKITEPVFKRTTIVRRSESSTTQGFGLTFIDYMPESSDTIHILIPNPKQPFKTAVEPKTEAKELRKTITDIEASAQSDTVSHALINQQVDTAVMLNRNGTACSQTATDRDFRNLRKDMAALETDEGMINTAVAVFREKCFTTEQVRNLSTLFLSAQWKYQFFEAAQKYTVDAENFANLASELKDEYYINRFKALLAK